MQGPRFNVYIVMLICLTLTAVHTDDQFICCMRGIKSIRDVEFCPAPCCRGYEERIVYTPQGARIAFCRRSPPQLQPQSDSKSRKK